MTRILVVNHAHSHVCGIHDLGLRIHRCLTVSEKFDVDYAACANVSEFDEVVRGYDAVIVNHRDDLTPWAAHPLPIPKIAVLHQYEEATADIRAEALLGRFDWVIALDPCLKPQNPRLVAVGRPIPEAVNLVPPDYRPIIGSFGFAFGHKRFDLVATEIASLCRPATLRLHCPTAHFGGSKDQTDAVIDSVWSALAGSDVSDVVSTNHQPETEVLEMLSKCHVNCLFYAPGQPDAGQSSALDYLIAARRPMLLSEASMFRSAWNAPRWPATRLGEILRNYSYYQSLADRLYGWHYGRLVRDIETLMERVL